MKLRSTGGAPAIASHRAIAAGGCDVVEGFAGEGVVPPVRFVKGGQIDQDIFALIRSNFRGTREISGDFRAQTAANRLGAQRIEALVKAEKKLNPNGGISVTIFFGRITWPREGRVAAGVTSADHACR